MHASKFFFTSDKILIFLYLPLKNIVQKHIVFPWFKQTKEHFMPLSYYNCIYFEDIDTKKCFVPNYIGKTETLHENETIFLSEKIFKPIYCCQPFIVFGNPGTLKELHNLGFKTFSDFWDESYDEDYNFTSRLGKIMYMN